MLKSTLAAGALALFTLFAGTMPALALDAAPVMGSTADPAAAAPAAVSPAERDALLNMREEEKLAHDIYVKLYAAWGLPAFNNIAAAEQRHTDAVAGLLQRYGLGDPTAGKAAGEFTNADLQALYDQLVAQGAQSAAEALKVGAKIEEIDILDLQDHMAETTNAAILRVYGNLQNASGNHLRAFVATLKNQTGASYAPQQMTQAAYDAIVSATGDGRHGLGQRSGNGRR